MINFKNIYVSDDGNRLRINCEIQDEPYFDDMYITGLAIDTQETYLPTGVSSKAVYSKEFQNVVDVLIGEDLSQYDKSKFKDYNTRSFDISLDSKDMIGLSGGLNDNIFFVYVFVGGTPAPNTPCGMDNSFYTAIAYNKSPLFKNILNGFRNASESIPDGLSSDILHYKLFELALRTGDVNKAIQIWKKIKKDKASTKSITECNCNGPK